MPTRSFDFFCLPDEALHALGETIPDTSVVSLYTEGARGGLPLKLVRPEELAHPPKVLWANVGKNEPRSFLGLVRICLPRYEENMLCMGSIAIKAEGDQNDIPANLKLYEQVKKAFRQRLKPGLWGINRKYGGEHFYKNLYISEGAVAQFRGGRELAPEAGDGFVRFEYRTA